jgi:Immunoglobulin I-set domain
MFHIYKTFICTITAGQPTVSTGLVFTEEPADIVVVRGQSVVWNCSAMSSDGASLPNMTWFKNGQPISDPRRQVLENGSLYIQRVLQNSRRSDEDLYECMATNEFGSILSRPAFLHIACEPSMMFLLN